MSMFIDKTKELRQGLFSYQDILDIFGLNLGVSYIHHKENPVLLGEHFLLKVNTSVGISNFQNLDEELRKIEAVSECYYSPDLIMDHTPINLKKPLWKYLAEMTSVPIGTVPVYTVFDKSAGIGAISLMLSNYKYSTIFLLAMSGILINTFNCDTLPPFPQGLKYMHTS